MAMNMTKMIGVENDVHRDLSKLAGELQIRQGKPTSLSGAIRYLLETVKTETKKTM